MRKKNLNAENLFWLTLLLLAIVYIILQLLAQNSIKKPTKYSHQNSIVPERFITTIKEFIVDDDTVRRLLEDNATLHTIESSIARSLVDLNSTIDENAERLFLPIYKRVDLFLDFHYSVAGEYSELGYAVTSEIENMIEERLFGAHFSQDLEKFTNRLNLKFIEEFKSQKEALDSYLARDIDADLNSKIVERLHQDIQQTIDIQQGKLLALLGAGASYKVIVALLSAKMAAKLTSKVAIKGALKASSKLGAVGGGLTVGALCGPAAIVCSPLLALAAWVGTDALLISGDEYLHREQFKKDIVNSIDEQKNTLKERYKRVYAQEFRQNTDEMIEGYQNLPLKKRERRRVKEIIAR